MTESWASSEAVRRSMKSNRSRDTGPELRLRSELHRRGLRYFVDRAPIKGVRRRADITFPRKKIAVFVDGCFWHGCPEHFTVAKTNAEYWAAKVEANQTRDRDTDRLLIDAGWTVLRVWEHEDVEDAAERVVRVVRPRGDRDE
ncbi:very short patch repair endonuclease [Gordonia sihwensis]|uniref:very short patch repair endonuclease n=1 Tax=Gordonia TaxID=2053 RepID=UPI002417C044|nr:very short patch repair endonuclease [Gordonia sihwensis]WFN93695.1 very short patch repair endonuclease [Gordonia sihwensis]